MKQITEACGCCKGIEIVTPQPTANRPGLPSLSYRIGTHATFLETMLAQLSSSDYPKLADLTTRESDDPSMALMDAWAIVADVLTFYNERIVNEGYLRTATERRSILELARLVGYKLRPGVASSVYLAYTLDNTKDKVIIPKGARSQSLPGPGELPQSFETSEDLEARAHWNNLKPRLTHPQTPISINNVPISGINPSIQGPRIYLKGTNTNLKSNDPLLIDFGGPNPFNTSDPGFFRVKEVKPDPGANRTLVILQSIAAESTAMSLTAGPQKDSNIGLIEALNQAPSVQPANSLRLDRNVKSQFAGNITTQEAQPSVETSINVNSSTSLHKTMDAQSFDDTLTPSESLRRTLAGGEASHSALKAFAPILKETLATAAANAQVTLQNPIRVYALRNKASAFGHNMTLPTELPTPILINVAEGTSAAVDTDTKLPLRTLALDAEYKEIKSDDWIAVERQHKETSLRTSLAYRVETVTTQTLGGSQQLSPPPRFLHYVVSNYNY